MQGLEAVHRRIPADGRTGRRGTPNGMRRVGYRDRGDDVVEYLGAPAGQRASPRSGGDQAGGLCHQGGAGPSEAKTRPGGMGNGR